MSFDAAVRLTEICLGLALLQQSLEHLVAPWDERCLFIPRIALALLLVGGFQPLLVESLLLLVSLAILYRFDGPYNGGSDRMGLLILCCLWLARLAPTRGWQEVAMSYLAVQVVLSYALSGWVKLANPAWRNGRALAEIFQFSVYPVSESMRAWARWPRSLTGLSWALMLFEALFPLALIDGAALTGAMLIAASFHLANACWFGLNRFLWSWLAAYPSLLWFQERVIPSWG